MKKPPEPGKATQGPKTDRPMASNVEIFKASLDQFADFVRKKGDDVPTEEEKKRLAIAGIMAAGTLGMAIIKAADQLEKIAQAQLAEAGIWPTPPKPEKSD